ncbi:hypothetical protein MLD38_002776 [Melastoma candidum]|uniref:Uncharacterized protein n=1 Tax=Melastoma candidum TaxID=119954 RepID=A0ACB9S0P2_9MYRT|nr:hypothetical protein MLD38_002776 [Melastoma candidum]
MDAARHPHASSSSSSVTLASFLVLATLAAPGVHAANRQSDFLRRLYRAKSDGSGSVDTALFHSSGDHSPVSSLLNRQEASKADDKIVSLPGQPPVDFDQYSGYVTVSPSAGRALFYYFAEAPHAKESLPLVLWLNGGPGCSSLAYGAMEELGPFRVHSDGKTLYRNRYSWNLAANVLFLESPVGVGFSYSNTSTDYQDRGDKNTAYDNYVFLLNWLERFPEYKGRDFYITGESYAGHYVPQLAHNILFYNGKKANDSSSSINLKGIMIGNAVINDETDTRGMYAYFASHALISSEAGEVIQKYCNFSSEATSQSDQCTNAANEASNDVGDLDIYNIYAPLCQSSNLTARPKKASVENFDPCSDNYVYAYLNRPEVQRALHANVTKLDHDWEPCSSVISGWGDSPDTIIPLLREFMAKGIRVWIYSGDIDGRVPVTSTQYSIAAMKLPIKTGWRPWYLSSEVGGYSQVYRGDITFATVRGAGHEVPSYQPNRALVLVSHFLRGTHLPN